MPPEQEIINEFAKQRDYEWGFETDIESDTLPPGLNEQVVEIISGKKDEPQGYVAVGDPGRGHHDHGEREVHHRHRSDQEAAGDAPSELSGRGSGPAYRIHLLRPIRRDFQHGHFL